MIPIKLDFVRYATTAEAMPIWPKKSRGERERGDWLQVQEKPAIHRKIEPPLSGPTQWASIPSFSRRTAASGLNGITSRMAPLPNLACSLRSTAPGDPVSTAG
jgi:hypothetical protein